MDHCFKYIIFYLTMVAFAITTFSKNIILLNFSINQGTIAEKYCVNKDKPAMHCNGHCYLQKQLQHQQQQEQALMDAFGKNEVVVCQNNFPKLPVAFCHEQLLTAHLFIPHTTSLYQRLIDKRLLKPPIFI